MDSQVFHICTVEILIEELHCSALRENDSELLDVLLSLCTEQTELSVESVGQLNQIHCKLVIVSVRVYIESLYLWSG